MQSTLNRLPYATQVELAARAAGYRPNSTRFSVRRMIGRDGQGVREGSELFNLAVAAAREKGLSHLYTPVTVRYNDADVVCRVFAEEDR